MQDIHSIPGGRMFGAAAAASSAVGDRRLRPHGHHGHHHQHGHHPNHQALKCPRCDSLNTKFCYYNNYNLSQPRHFCKSCRRYWTKGGALRNIPVGGGTRKTAKRASSKSKRHNAGSGSDTGADHPQAPGSSQAHSRTAEEASQSPPPGFVGPTLDLDPARFYGSPSDLERRMLDVNGSFSSLLGTSGPFLSILEGPNLNASGASSMVRFGGLGDEVKPGHGHVPGSAREPGAVADGAENFMDIQNGDAGCWTGGSGWPDLAIYTPGSSFHR